MVRIRTRPGVEDEAYEVVVYPTGSTIITGPGPGDRGATHRGSAADGLAPVGDQVRRAVTVLHDGFDHARRFHARAGPRMGPNPAAIAPSREGTKSEIIRSVLVDPWRAWDLAESGRLFADPIPRLRIDQRAGHALNTYPVWPASLRTGWLTRRAAHLQVSASPSFNVTVLELIPAAPRRVGSRAFLKAGLPVIDEVARRLAAIRTHPLGSSERARGIHSVVE